MIERSEKSGTSRILEAKVARTEAAIRRVEDWALRFARNIEGVPTEVEALTKAKAGIEAILRDEKYDVITGLNLQPKNKYQIEGRARELTMIACQVLDALAVTLPAQKPARRKSNGDNLDSRHAGPRRPAHNPS